ncbi:DUF5701 family protein [Roseinatronobacter alkalisoli]|uniref:DUF5701 family protein n=1 Tax=Roseinatronobacter alkalisoli TaxID=3028235 RepID=A0ABT5T6Z0_9RHOB|nr:DUF5701 family protein [Roseinatronobacter sp. HJB301]MDD7969723.1 DUF5701 family protein [Roseinatronobacter sp. HJB301]
MLTDPLAEYDRQAELMSQRISNSLLNYDIGRFWRHIEELRMRVSALAMSEEASGNIPVVILLKQKNFRYQELMGQLSHKGRNGYVEMTPKIPEDFRDIESLAIPNADLYVLWDVDTGMSNLNISPSDSMELLMKAKRTPLTMSEGLFCALAVPELLTDKHRFNCIQMPGSRIEDDQRVPSIWLSKGAPRLGWCWFGNIHTWLATASCKSRLGAS